MLMLTTESQAEKKDAGRKASATGWIVNPFDSDLSPASLDSPQHIQRRASVSSEIPP
jgi:hypothetical protein